MGFFDDVFDSASNLFGDVVKYGWAGILTGGVSNMVNLNDRLDVPEVYNPFGKPPTIVDVYPILDGNRQNPGGGFPTSIGEVAQHLPDICYGSEPSQGLTDEERWWYDETPVVDEPGVTVTANGDRTNGSGPGLMGIVDKLYDPSQKKFGTLKDDFPDMVYQWVQKVRKKKKKTHKNRKH